MCLAGGNSNIFSMFIAKIGEADEPILTHIFQMGWLKSSIRCVTMAESGSFVQQSAIFPWSHGDVSADGSVSCGAAGAAFWSKLPRAKRQFGGPKMLSCLAVATPPEKRETGWWFQTFFIFSPIRGRFPF